MTPNHLELKSADGTKLNLEALYQIAPSCFTEVKDEKTGELRHVVNFTTLRQLLGDDAVEDANEMYQFTWPGKQEARREAARPISDTLRPCPEESVDWDTTQNLYIEGDNLAVLKLLQKGYMGKVKMIYIDPPYNTGNDFVYHDDFAVSQKEMDLFSGDVDEEGNRYRKNTDSNGRFHSDWCSMMYSRLSIARSLLTEEGVIFISIDDNEIDNLRKLCDEIFGIENFVANLIWEQGRKSMAAQVAVNHEYCLIYCKNRDKSIAFEKGSQYPYWMTPKTGLDEIYSEFERLSSIYKSDYSKIEAGMRKFYKDLPESSPSKAHSHYKCVDKKGLYFPGDIAQGTGNGGRFPILHPITNKPCKMPAGGWRFGEAKLPLLLKDDRIHFGEDETTVPCLKRYLRETEFEVMSSVFYKDGRGASKRLDQLMEVKGLFPFPKDELIIKSFVAAGSSDEESIILDFFSGSATTAHSVFLQNIEDSGNRKFILVQIPEKTEDGSIAQRAGYENICEIGKERIRRAGQQIKDNAPLTTQSLDTGFRVLKLADSNFNNVEFTPKEFTQDLLSGLESNIKEGRTDLDLLFGAMLDWGVQLSLPMSKETVDGCDIYTVNEGDLVACFSENVSENVVVAMASKMPLRVLFRDSCFSEDKAKINVFELFKQKLDWGEDEAIKNIRVI